MHNVAYYTGFLYCAFGRPYAAVVTASGVTTVSANIDAGQPWRRCYGDNLVYTDWQRNNFWRALEKLVGNVNTISIEYDHMVMDLYQQMKATFPKARLSSISDFTMQQRMVNVR